MKKEMEARSRESPRTFSSRSLFLLISLVPINTLNPKILMTALFYKSLISQGEIWCWSLVALKRLTKGVELANWIYKQLTADLLNWQALFILQWASKYVISEQKIPLEDQKNSYMLERTNYPFNKKIPRCSKTYAPANLAVVDQLHLSWMILVTELLSKWKHDMYSWKLIYRFSNC